MSFPYPHQCLDHSSPCGGHIVLPLLKHLGTTSCKLWIIVFNFLQFGHFDPQVEAQGDPIIDLLQFMHKVSQLRSWAEKRQLHSMLFQGLFKCLRYNKQFSVCCPNYAHNTTCIATLNVPTNSEAGTLWSFTPSRVGGHTPIVACIARLDTPHLKCATFPREVLPPILLTLLSKLFPLPLVAQGLCTSGLDWECNCLPWNSILLACWLRCNLRRFGCKSEWG